MQLQASYPRFVHPNALKSHSKQPVKTVQSINSRITYELERTFE